MQFATHWCDAREQRTESLNTSLIAFTRKERVPMHCVACEEENERNGTDTEKQRQDVNPPAVKVRLFGLFSFTTSAQLTVEAVPV